MTDYLFIHLGSSTKNTLTKMYEIRTEIECYLSFAL